MKLPLEFTMFIKPNPLDQPINEQGGNHAGPPEGAAGEAAWRGGVALETNAGFAGMARGIAIDAKPGERGPAVAKVGSSESNREGAGAFWSESGPLKSKSVKICPLPPRNDSKLRTVETDPDPLQRFRAASNSGAVFWQLFLPERVQGRRAAQNPR